MPYASAFRPLRIPESSYLLVCSAATWLCGPDRDAFWLHVRTELEAQPELGEGVIARAVAGAFGLFYRPIEIPKVESDPLRKLTYGSRRLEAKLDLIEARRVRRVRGDAR